MQNIFGAIKKEQARKTWIKLETEYEEAAADNVPLLSTKLYGCTFRQGQSASNFFAELEQLTFRLRSLNANIDDELIMAKVILSLPSDLRIFRIPWESTPVTEKTLKKLTSRLIALDKSIRNVDERRSTPDVAFLSKNKEKDDSQSEESRELVLPAKHDREKEGGHSSHHYSGTKECWECGSTTHIRAQCRKYKRRREKKKRRLAEKENVLQDI